MDALHQIDAWDVPFAAAGVTRAGETIATRGDTSHRVRLASVSKPVAALATLVAAEEGVLDESCGMRFALDISPDGKRICGIHYDGRLGIWDFSGQRMVDVGKIPIVDVARFSPNGERILAVTRGVHEFDAYTGSHILALEMENVVCVRTFSKAHGLAGFRVGYGIAGQRVADYVERVRFPFSVNLAAQAAAAARFDTPSLS